ncbi:MAG: hypothetical protein AMXMBFR64_30830 [Myxococcales bacterium]
MAGAGCRGVAGAWLALALVACSEDPERGDAGPSTDALDVLAPDDVPSRADAAGDTAADAPAEDDAAPHGEDTSGLAGPYEPCTGPKDCASGWCVQTWEGEACAPPCDDGCADGWLCTQDLASFPDVVFLCVPAHPSLCRPCKGDGDCPGAACVSHGDEGSFCGGDCESATCPPGFSCLEAPTASGPRLQCVLDAGECPCSPAAVAAGASTLCAASGPLGACHGERHCTSSGLTACSASPPSDELCNGLDDDCDGAVDEGLAGASCTVAGSDGACHGTLVCTASGGSLCDAPLPAPEACNGKDDDCDGAVDEPGALGCTQTWKDKDGDGWGAGEVSCACAPTGALAPGDCDDADPAAHPGAEELCNGVDDDCDGLTDEEGASGCTPWFLDGDADGWGADDEACLCGPSGAYTVTDGGDCDDGNGSVHPGAVEACNLFDDDCDGLADPPGAQGCTPYFADADGDTWGDGSSPACLCAPAPPLSATNPGDCDDGDAGVHPAAPEACNGKDDDCDGLVDEGAAAGCTFWYADADRDGWGKPGTVVCACAAVPPATATEVGDCDDQDPAVNPGTPEVCNGKDDDCDGLTDEAAAEGCAVWYVDADGDGFGQSAASACLCAPTAPFLATEGGDCNDGTAAISPAAPEACNGFDDDCDGALDEEGAAGCTHFFRDDDGDGWGAAGDSRCLCSPAAPHTSKKLADCDDGDAAMSPSALEACNGLDDDCDGQTDEPGAVGCNLYYVDLDGDGHGKSGTGVCLCAGSGEHTALADGDCDDGDPATSPAAPEECNAADDDCDGGVDEGCALAPTGWPTYKHDTRRTGHRADVVGPASAATGWTHALAPGAGLNNSVALVPDGIIAQGGKKLVKLSFTGEPIWSAELPVSTFSRNSPTVREGGTILVPTGGELRLYGPAGDLLWTATFAGESITAAPMVAEDGAIYVLSTAGLRRVDAAGSVVWTSPAPNTQTSPGHPAVSPNGRIHFATSNHSVYSVIPETGQAAWVYTHPQGFDTDSSVAVSLNGDVYQGFGNTVARLASDGALLGSVGVGGDMDGDVALLQEGESAFVYASPNGASGLRRYTAELVHLWTYPLTKDGGANGVPVFDGEGNAYVGDDTGLFVCVRADGTLRWSKASGASVVKSAAAVGDGFVVFGDGAGTLHFVGEAP